MNAKALVVEDKHKGEKGDWSPFFPNIRVEHFNKCTRTLPPMRKTTKRVNAM